jgi:hypothetical protein
MIGCVAVPVVTPVPSSGAFVCWFTLIKSAAVVIVALCVSSRSVDVNVGELQYFQRRCIPLQMISTVIL